MILIFVEKTVFAFLDTVFKEFIRKKLCCEVVARNLHNNFQRNAVDDGRKQSRQMFFFSSQRYFKADKRKNKNFNHLSIFLSNAF